MLALRKALFIFALIASVYAIGAQSAADDLLRVFTHLTSSELDAVRSGKPLFRTVSDVSMVGLARVDAETENIKKNIAAVRPNYITELLLAIPVENEKTATILLADLVTTLAAVEKYVKIPYWSKRNQKTYDLFDRMTVLRRKPFPDGESIEVVQHMEPFDDFKASYDYRATATSVRFWSSNLHPIVYTYRNFSAVASGNMRWELYAFSRRGMMYVYGVGVVRAFDFMGVFRDRLEPSFLGRVGAFFTHIAKNIEAKDQELR